MSADGHKDDSPLYSKIKRELVGAIQRGEYVSGRPFITQREVCQRFGVSSTTAVRALNDLVIEGYLVRQRGRGTFVAERREPPPAATARRSIACILHGAGPHISRLVDGVESACAQLGYQMTLSNTQNEPAIEENALRQALDAGASGVVLYPGEGQPDIPALAALRAAGVPLVAVDRYRPDIATDAVLADNFAVGYRLTSALIELGHRRIATLWSETQCSSVRDRLTGHLQALRQHDIAVRADLTVLRTYERLPEQRRLSILEDILGGAEPATALLCGNGYVLATAAHDLAVLGVGTPDQIELAGMDDAGPFNLLPLTLVAAALPSHGIGVKAVQLLHERIVAGTAYDEPHHVVLPIEIRTRTSAKGYLSVVSSRSSTRHQDSLGRRDSHGIGPDQLAMPAAP